MGKLRQHNASTYIAKQYSLIEHARYTVQMWLGWEKVPLTHKDKYLEIRNYVSAMSSESLKLQAYHM